MFREMRRARQQLSAEETEKILKEGSFGVLALGGEYPYAVPLSYEYRDGALYFHGATAGQRYDLTAQGGNASFCVVARDEVHGEEYTTYYKSAIAFGKLAIVTDGEEARRALMALGAKYNPSGSPQEHKAEVDAYPRVCVSKLTIEHMTGKQGKNLAQG